MHSVYGLFNERYLTCQKQEQRLKKPTKTIMTCVLKCCHCECLVVSDGDSLSLDITCVVYAYCNTITALSITGIDIKYSLLDVINCDLIYMSYQCVIFVKSREKRVSWNIKAFTCSMFTKKKKAPLLVYTRHDLEVNFYTSVERQT